MKRDTSAGGTSAAASSSARSSAGRMWLLHQCFTCSVDTKLFDCFLVERRFVRNESGSVNVRQENKARALENSSGQRPKPLGNASERALAGRPDCEIATKRREIDGSRKVTKKKLPWQMPATGAELAATSGRGLHSHESVATSEV